MLSSGEIAKFDPFPFAIVFILIEQTQLPEAWPACGNKAMSREKSHHKIGAAKDGFSGVSSLALLSARETADQWKFGTRLIRGSWDDSSDSRCSKGGGASKTPVE
jgi:hypothetical protein